MGTLKGLKQSNIARYGTYGLVILWYIIFVVGSLFQFGFGSSGIREQAIQIGWASVVFIVLLGISRWFFETKSS